MADPAPTQILDIIATRLANITTTNGYYTDVKKIVRGSLEPFKGYDLPFIYYWMDSLSNERSVYDDDNRSIDLSIGIHDLTRDRSFNDVANELAADVIIALNRSDANPKVSDDPNYDLNDAISDLVFNGYDTLISGNQDPWCGALIRFTLKYRCDPFEVSSYGA